MIGQLLGGSKMDRELSRLVWHWLRATRASDAARREREIDQAVADTFPASDPVPAVTAADATPEAHEVDCLLDCGRLTFVHGNDSERRAMLAGAGEPVMTIEGQAPDGQTMRIRVRLPADADACALQAGMQAEDGAPGDGSTSSLGTRSGGRSEGGSEAGLDIKPRAEAQA